MVEEHTIRKCQKAYDFLAFLVINNYRVSSDMPYRVFLSCGNPI